jgi:hypothetical protein
MQKIVEPINVNDPFDPFDRPYDNIFDLFDQNKVFILMSLLL